MSKTKGSKVKITSCAFDETIYEARKYINDTCFGNETNKSLIGNKIIDNIVHRCWMKPKLRKMLSNLMLP